MQYAEHTRPTPQKHRCGPAAVLNTSFRQRIADFITSSKSTRRMPFIQVKMKLGLNLSKPTISRAMKKEGIFRRLARKKPPISEKNRLLRLAFAHQHRYWTRLQWDIILWTDETWVTNGRHTRTWVSRRVSEEYEADFIVEKAKYKSGWMFWAHMTSILIWAMTDTV